MIASKTATLLAMAALLPALFAAEPDTPTSADVVQPVPSSPEAIAEQAALVRQIGADAARGFDPEAHAHALRVQIETLVKEPSVPPAPLLTKPPAPAVAPPEKRKGRPPSRRGRRPRNRRCAWRFRRSERRSRNWKRS